MTSKQFSLPLERSNKFNFKKNTIQVVVVVTDLFSNTPIHLLHKLMNRYRDPPSAREALEKLNGFELAGRAIRVGLGNDKFTNESTQAILDRYDGFRGSIMETVPRGDTERIGGGGSGGRGGGGGRIPSNLDDTDIAGVSFQNVSREALMKKLARDEPKVEPVMYVPISFVRCFY
jgi:linker between RRM2 and RRM3 domains in RBM39 protein